MTFLQYKLQFVDLEVPNILDSGLHWHDGSGQLNVAEWSFTHLRVKDLPEKTQYNYKIEVATPLLANAEKRFEKEGVKEGEEVSESEEETKPAPKKGKKGKKAGKLFQTMV